MDCKVCNEKLDAYFDGELSAEDARSVAQHLRGCSSCAAEGLARVQLKRAVHAAGQKFTPDPDFRARVQRQISAQNSPTPARGWVAIFGVAAVAVVLIAAISFFVVRPGQTASQQLWSELIDQHVSTLASGNMVDVVSSDRHTVKPWFEGKIPFTFNLPELQGSPFVLIGGRVDYLKQSPGAELIFGIRQHRISLFIFRNADIPGDESQTVRTDLSFQVRHWRANGLTYFMISDASPQDLDQLSNLIKSVN